MNSFAFLAAVVMAGLLVSAFRSTSNLKAKLAGKTGSKPLVSKGFGMLIMLAQVSELLKAVEHASLVSIAASLIMLAIWQAVKTGTEDNL